MELDQWCAVSDVFVPDGRRADLDVVLLPPEVDVSNAEMVLAALAAVLERGVRIVIADMTDTVFCDCTGVAALVSTWRRAERSGAELRIAAGTAQVRRVFEITGLERLMAVYPTTAAACQQACPAEQVRPDA
jgi:anti-sigma B factor antagonist